MAMAMGSCSNHSDDDSPAAIGCYDILSIYFSFLFTLTLTLATLVTLAGCFGNILL